jgi:translation initiation factor 5
MPPKVQQVPVKKDEDSSYRYKMPRLTPRKMSSGNGVKTSIINSSDIAKAINRTQACLTQWFGYALACQSRISAQSSQIVLNGDHNPKKLQDSLYEFIDYFILCPCCSNPETTMDKKGNQLLLHCHACGKSEAACQGAHPNYVQKTLDWILAHMTTEQKQTQNVTVRSKGRLDEIDEFQQQKAAEVNDAGTGIAIDVEDLKKAEAEIDSKTAKAKLTQEEEEEYIKKLKKQLAGEESDLEVYEEFTSVAESGGWSSLTRLNIIYECLFNGATKELLAILKDRRGFLIRVCCDDDTQKEFLQFMAKYIEISHPELLSSAPIIWYTLYDNEIVEDGGMQKFISARISKRFEDSTKGKQLRKLLEPFYKWLETAEVEPEPEEPEDEEPAPAPVAPAQEKAEDKEEINIDDI